MKLLTVAVALVNMMGKVTEVLGENMAPGMETKIAIHTHQIPNEWPEAVDKQIASR
ncbi:hypothetical protein OH492_22115 [Vibrio chagasii]|nr:hypothetical protein [Vibrio chagasii]